MPATLRDDLYKRLIERLRHAEQYADAARRMANGAHSALVAKDKDVVAMMATVAPGLDERLMDQLRHAEQYAEAARFAVKDVLNMLDEAAKGKSDA